MTINYRSKDYILSFRYLNVRGPILALFNFKKHHQHNFQPEFGVSFGKIGKGIRLNKYGVGKTIRNQGRIFIPANNFFCCITSAAGQL